jgi:hypothetical protein
MWLGRAALNNEADHTDQDSRTWSPDKISATGASYRVLPITLVAGLAKAHGQRRPDEKLLALAKPKLLIDDELGYLPLEPNTAHLFFQLVSRRYETRAILITSNRSFAERVATAILDRLLHQSHVLTVRRDSNRLHVKRKSGFIKARRGRPSSRLLPFVPPAAQPIFNDIMDQGWGSSS